jgi:hypothetical protein
MLVEVTGLPITTSALAGPYGVVRQSVGTKGWLLQWLPQAGGLGHGVPATFAALDVEAAVDVDVEVVVAPSEVAESVVAGGFSAGGVC